jgi:hypothetical protein
MSQSGKNRVERARSFLLQRVPLDGISALGKERFARFLDEQTRALSKELPKPGNGVPNWGAARKVLNIYLRMCAMNKDFHPAFNLESLEPYLEVPLDRQIVKWLDAKTGAARSKTFRIRDLQPDLSAEIQESAIDVATGEQCHRYELDVLYWNQARGRDVRCLARKGDRSDD